MAASENHFLGRLGYTDKWCGSTGKEGSKEEMNLSGLKEKHANSLIQHHHLGKKLPERDQDWQK